MDKLAEHLPQIISAAAQSQLGIMALLSVALAVLAWAFFAGASEKVRVGIFVLLFAGVAGFGVAMFRAAPAASAATLAPAATDAATPPAPDPAAALSPEATILLREAAADPAGVVVFAHYGMGAELTTNDKSLLPDQSRRTLAAWEAALQQLVAAGLLAARGERGEVFEITQRGYDAAARLSGS